MENVENVENVRRLNTGLADSPRISIELGSFLCSPLLGNPGMGPLCRGFFARLCLLRGGSPEIERAPRRVHNRIAVVAAAGRHTKLSVVLGQPLDRRPFNLQVAVGTLGRIMKVTQQGLAGRRAPF